ncbi:hypothetical protein [Mariniblastus fucicola]|uniref:Uncharacterized protein n=1 Tax=Mariniblastus fucicola TaxID=980251 RepID=A0A5B9PHI9_9BACT|nr:hypothetical protein [Mariniblastus fucicola]QEG22341.1 hypothetical protein MFFC18_22210 [Mariniblastus fucicola]
MSSNRNIVCAVVLCVVGMSFTGCRNRCQPNYYPYQQQPYANQYGYNTAPNYGQQYGAAGGRSQVIPPPGTGTLNIPSIARNNPFGVNQNRGLLNTGGNAPTPANGASQFNQQNGWQSVGGNTANPASNPNPNNNQSNATQPTSGTTTLGSNSTANPAATGQESAAPASARSVLVQNTQAPANQGYGDSYVRSPDYSTTAVNETYDRTRLPATDASAVRAPSQYYARASGVQVAQLPGQGMSGYQQPYYSGTFSVPSGQYNAASGMVQTGNATNAVFAANTNAVVQGQSTASYDPYNNTRSADWRNRDTSGTFQ